MEKKETNPDITMLQELEFLFLKSMAKFQGATCPRAHVQQRSALGVGNEKPTERSLVQAGSKNLKLETSYILSSLSRGSHLLQGVRLRLHAEQFVDGITCRGNLRIEDEGVEGLQHRDNTARAEREPVCGQNLCLHPLQE